MTAFEHQRPVVVFIGLNSTVIYARTNGKNMEGTRKYALKAVERLCYTLEHIFCSLLYNLLFREVRKYHINNMIMLGPAHTS